jgi:hypothetical protein
MDPYLEGPAWDSFHAQFIGELGRQLAPLFRPKYIARVEGRTITETPDALEELAVATTSARPDVSVLQRNDASAQGAAATATLLPPLQFETLITAQFVQWSLHVSDIAERRLVTAIEMLSPSNKTGEDRAEYLRRRDKFLTSATHLIEIDLLPRGRRVPMRKPLPAAPYFVFVSRMERRPLTDTWPIDLSDRLPSIPVPLLSPDSDVDMNLQAAMNSMYDAFGYDLELNYGAPPEMVLSPEQTSWAQRILQAAGHSWNEGGHSERIS